MDEEWETIAEARSYEISNLGRVRNKKTGRILRPSINRAGQQQVVLMDAGIRVGRTVDKLVEFHFGSFRTDEF